MSSEHDGCKQTHVLQWLSTCEKEAESEAWILKGVALLLTLDGLAQVHSHHHTFASSSEYDSHFFELVDLDAEEQQC
jgi:hypothetical protein